MGDSQLVNVIFNNYILLSVVLLLALFYRYITATRDFFKDKNIPYLKPLPIFGNNISMVFKKTSFFDFHLQMYKRFEGLPYAGYFEGHVPRLLLRDPELIKTVMVKDFDHFTDRQEIPTNDPPSMSKILLRLKGKEWKSVRSIMTPTFSSGKLRGMENIFQDCAKQMVKFLQARNEKSIEMSEFTKRYTLEVIGSCAFGLDLSTMKSGENPFLYAAKHLKDKSALRAIILETVTLLFPEAVPYIPFITPTNLQSLGTLQTILTEAKAIKEQGHGEIRHDFIQMMLDVAEKEAHDENKEKVMTDDMMHAQSIMFILAGLDTTSVLLTFTSYLLSKHQEIQDDLRNDLMKLSKDYSNSDRIYDALNEISLLDEVFNETLRLYPPIARVERLCVKPLSLPEVGLQFNKGDIVTIPIAGIMRDEKYYPEPEKFIPERFSHDEKKKRPSHLFLPFGMGPRNCIGLRFAMMEAKFAMYHLLTNYKLKPSEKNKEPLEFVTNFFILNMKNGTWVDLEPLKK